jgi:hypothetical protein
MRGEVPAKFHQHANIARRILAFVARREGRQVRRRRLQRDGRWTVPLSILSVARCAVLQKRLLARCQIRLPRVGFLRALPLGANHAGSRHHRHAPENHRTSECRTHLYLRRTTLAVIVRNILAAGYYHASKLQSFTHNTLASPVSTHSRKCSRPARPRIRCLRESREVWMVIGKKAWAPRVSSPPIRIVRMPGSALHFGVEAYTFSGATLRVFSPAKTVAECFKFRNKIGLDVAIEALKESRRTLDAFSDPALPCWTR